MTARRPGFSLAELTVAMLIGGIIGIALARLIINQSRFVAMQDAMMRARSGARAALNALSGELRAVTDGGLVGLVGTGPDSITVRVPYAFGVACQTWSPWTIVSLLPTDLAIYSASTASGYAWRDSTGAYRFIEPAVVSVRLSSGWCSPPAPSITTLSATGWSASAVFVSPNDVATPVGAIVYLYQTIRYAFKASVEIPGRRALWRTVVSTGTRDELVAPFDSSAKFQFLVGGAYALQSAPPPVLDSVRGVRVKLVGASETAPQGRSQPVKFDLTTDILFRNNARQ